LGAEGDFRFSILDSRFFGVGHQSRERQRAIIVDTRVRPARRTLNPVLSDDPMIDLDGAVGAACGGG